MGGHNAAEWVVSLQRNEWSQCGGIRNWINGNPIESIERKYSVTPFAGSVGAGDIRGYADRTRMYLRAAYEIVDILLLGEGPDEDDIDNLLKQLETGLPAEALGLIELPIALPRGEYLELFNAGFTKPEDVLSLKEHDLRMYIAQERVSSLKS